MANPRPRMPLGSMLLLCLALLPFQTLFAQTREAVLKQIDVPHDYYFREMYLPQLTTGPSSATWSPDGEELIYSMAGSLWRQRVGETVATQLTDGPGYDYQPDWSPNGDGVVFSRYNNDALELQLLNLATGKVSALTTGGSVNLDARFSPDGSQLAYVSTKDTKHFRVWVGTLKNATLAAQPLTPERQTKIIRYYYSQYDHQLSPSWSPDGKSLVMVTNPDNIYGTGPIYRMDLDDRDNLILIQKEETTWRARPDWSPDGNRIVYSSYLGRNWNQLWITTADGNGNPYPLTYGKYDATNPRWSPDAKRIAYISNESGNTALWIFETLTGKRSEIKITERKYLKPSATLSITIKDESGNVVPARVSVISSNGRSYAPDNEWMYGDDAFDRSKQKFETYYFHTRGQSTVTLPAGKAELTVWRGLENKIQRRTVDLTSGRNELVITMESFKLPDTWSNWVSGDVHVHMNYGGHYRNTPAHMVEQAEAEDLDIVFNLVVNKEQRIPDMDYFSPDPDKASNENVLLLHGQEHHTSYWGHMGFLGLTDHYFIPGYSTYPNTAVASAHPSNSVMADLAHEQNALVGYVHPYYEIPDPQKDAAIHHALPIDVALGHVDYYETVGFSYHRPSAEVWYRLLNCGFRISAAGGTDAMCNYASLRGPVGVDRTYVDVKEQSSDPVKRKQLWLDGLKAGRSVATNGPLLGLTVNGKGPGEELALSGKKNKVTYKGFMRSIVPIDHLELVANGKVIKTIPLAGDKMTADFEGTVTVTESSWLLVRAWNENGTVGVLDFYPYGTTNPSFLIVNDKPIRSAQDAEYFIQWIDRVTESAEKQPYFTESERNLTLSNIKEARKVFENRK